MYLLVLSENLKTSLCSRTTVFPGFAGTFSFGARLTPLNLALLEKREKQRFNEFCHSPSHVIFYNCPVLSMAALSFAAMPCIFFLLTAQTAILTPAASGTR